MHQHGGKGKRYPFNSLLDRIFPASNSGHDPLECLVKLREEQRQNGGAIPVGLDVKTGEAVNPVDLGIYDNICVKKHMLDAR